MESSAIVQRVVIAIIIIGAGAIIYPFWEAIVWALLLGVGLWPIYAKWLKLCKHKHSLAAFSFTFIVALVIVLPLIWLTGLAISELITVIKYIKQVLENHQAPPHWFQELPYIGGKLTEIWQEYVGNPQKVAASLKSYIPHISNATAITGAIFTPIMLFFFTLLCLFYALKDGEYMTRQIHLFGENRFDNWHALVRKIPIVIRGVIDSIIYLGIGMGVVMGIIYYACGLPVPVFLGVLSAISTLIPFALSLVLVIVFIIAAVKGMVITGLVIFIIGNIINLMSDSWLRPIVIGRSVHIHFIAVLFGALGGIEVFGIIGIFLGPIFMVLIGVLWESAVEKNQIAPKK